MCPSSETAAINGFLRIARAGWICQTQLQIQFPVSVTAGPTPSGATPADGVGPFPGLPNHGYIVHTYITLFKSGFDHCSTISQIQLPAFALV